MKINSRDILIGCAVHCVAWIAAIIIIRYVMSHSDSVDAYAYLSAWWCTLYVGYVVRTPLLSSVAAGLIYFSFGVVSLVFNWQWFYRGLPDALSLRYVFLSAFGALVFCSPIIINWFVRQYIERSGSDN